MDKNKVQKNIYKKNKKKAYAGNFLKIFFGVGCRGAAPTHILFPPLRGGDIKFGKSSFFRTFKYSLIAFLVISGFLFPVESYSQGNLLEGEIVYEKYIENVAKYHPLILQADIERRIAAAKLLQKQGAFDPKVSIDSMYLRYNDFIDRGNPSKTWDNVLELSLPTRSGLEFIVGAQHNSGDVKPPLYPTGDSGEYFLGVKMPILRGFRLNKNAVEEMQSEIGIPAADAAFNKIRLEVLLKAAERFWDWVISYKKREINEEVLGLAEFRRDSIQKRVENGDLPEIDSVEADQEVLLRKGNLVKTKREYEKQLFKLSRYLWQPDGMPYGYPEKDNIPDALTEPKAYTETEWAAGVESALEHRPEIKILDLQKEILELDLKYAKNQKLPEANVYAYPGTDTGNESVGFTLNAGVELIIPLRQRAAKGLIKVAEYKTNQLDIEQRLVLQNVLLEIDDAFSAINAQYQQFIAAKNEYELAKKLEAGERDRFKFGDTSLFIVNQRERMRAETAIKLLNIKAKYYKAVARFNAVTVQLLNENL